MPEHEELDGVEALRAAQEAGMEMPWLTPEGEIVDLMADDQWWHDKGYIYGRQLDRGMYHDLWVCVHRMAYTWRLMLCTPQEVLEFWCYPHDLSLDAIEGVPVALTSLAYVLKVAEQYDGQGDPADGWVKHHPSHRRRPKQ